MTGPEQFSEELNGLMVKHGFRAFALAFDVPGKGIQIVASVDPNATIGLMSRAGAKVCAMLEVRGKIVVPS